MKLRLSSLQAHFHMGAVTVTVSVLVLPSLRGLGGNTLSASETVKDDWSFHHMDTHNTHSS